MEATLNYIAQQLSSNSFRNILHKDVTTSWNFLPVPAAVMDEVTHLDKAARDLLLDVLTDKAIQQFCSVNQYYQVSPKANRELRHLYAELLSLLSDSDTSGHTMAEIAQQHCFNLQNWLTRNNPFVTDLYSESQEFIEVVPCYEYSPVLQIKLFGFRPEDLSEPVLDIGCGKEASLVKLLRQKGVEAFGLDRFDPDFPYVEKGDWLEYEYGSRRWGTILSHLGFSNHFHHHHLRIDGHYETYARKYMDILHSLKKGGVFYYAPSLEFIEPYLNPAQFGLEYRSTDTQGFKVSKITRLS